MVISRESNIRRVWPPRGVHTLDRALHFTPCPRSGALDFPPRRRSRLRPPRPPDGDRIGSPLRRPLLQANCATPHDALLHHGTMHDLQVDALPAPVGAA